MSEYALDDVVAKVEASAVRIERAATEARDSGNRSGPVVEELLNLRNAADDLGRYLWGVENVSGDDDDDGLEAAWRSFMYRPDIHLLGTLVLATERAIVAPREAVHGEASDRWHPCCSTARFLADRLQAWVAEVRLEVANV